MDELTTLLSSHNALEVVSPTGTGKSTIIPTALAKSGKRVLVSTDTRTSARLLTATVLMSYSSTGYAAEGEIRYTSSTMLVYATSGHVRRLLLRYFKDGSPLPSIPWDYLIVDESHVGSVDNSIIVGLWSFARWKTKLILMTATPVPYSLQQQPARLEIKQFKYPIEIEYTKDFENQGSLYKAIVQRILSLHSTTKYEDGHMLVFLPGSSDVRTMTNMIGSPFGALVLGVHGGMKAEDINRITEPTRLRKIIIATNVVESSITVSDLGFVLDSMLEKRPGTSPSGETSLSLSYISKKSAEQRAGRTGRTKQGKCIRFISELSYKTLEEFRPSDIHTIPIDKEVLELIASGLSPKSIVRDVDETRMDSIVKGLYDMELVKRGTMELTRLGTFSVNLPLSIHTGNFLWKWVSLNHPPFPGVVAAALINSKPHTLFMLPERGAPTEDYDRLIHDFREDKYGGFVGLDNLATCLNVWLNLFEYLDYRLLESYEVDEFYEWCDEHAINSKAMKEVMNTVNAVVRRLEEMNVDVEIGPFTPSNVVKYSSPLLMSVYRDNVITQVNGGYFDRQGSKYIVDSRGIPGDMKVYNTLLFITSVTTMDKSGKKTNIVSMSIPLPEGLAPLQTIQAPKQDKRKPQKTKQEPPLPKREEKGEEKSVQTRKPSRLSLSSIDPAIVQLVGFTPPPPPQEGKQSIEKTSSKMTIPKPLEVPSDVQPVRDIVLDPSSGVSTTPRIGKQTITVPSARLKVKPVKKSVQPSRQRSSQQETISTQGFNRLPLYDVPRTTRAQ